MLELEPPARKPATAVIPDDSDPIAWPAWVAEQQRRADETRAADAAAAWRRIVERAFELHQPPPIVPAQRPPLEALPPDLRKLADANGELPAAISAYLVSDRPEPYNAAASILARLSETQRADPLRGYTRGELAHAAQRAFDLEREGLSTPPGGGSEVDTELRDALSEINHLDGWQRKAQLLRKVQRIQGMRGHRTSVCLRYMTEQGPTDQNGHRVVTIMGRAAEAQPQLPLPGDVVAAEYARLRYRGVAVCGDGWCCPVCATKITERRRRELRAGMESHRESGGVALLLTFTFSHGPGEALREQWERLGKALQRWARSGEVKRFREQMGFAGRVRSREITYGINGWHPHAHMLELYDGNSLDRQSLGLWMAELRACWRRCCTMSGLECSLEHGFDASITKVDDYIAKWGLDAELAKWHVKGQRPNPDAPDEAGLNGYTPFDLLKIHAGLLEPHPRLRLDSNRAAALFSEYAAAVKGTAQLHWTRGLKALLEIADFTDQELAENVGGPEEHELGSLTAPEWFAVVSGNHQVELLGLVASKGWDVARLFVQHWRQQLDELQALTMRRVIANGRLRYLFRGSG